MRTVLQILFYLSAFFMTWGEGMQNVFPYASAIFPACSVLIIIICVLFQRISPFAYLPKKFKFFVWFLMIHTMLFICINPHLVSFGTVNVVERADGFNIGQTSLGDSIVKLVIFIFYGCFLTKVLSLKLIDINKYALIYGIGFSFTILLGGFSMEYGGTLRLSGGLSDPNAMAVDALVSLCLSWYIFKGGGKTLIRYASLFCVLVSCYALLMSFSRGAIVALAFMLFVLFQRKYHWTKLACASMAMIVLLFLVYNLILPSDIKEVLQMRFDLKEVKSSGGAGRTEIWMAYLTRWQHYIITGTGYDNCCSILRDHSEGLSISLNYVTHNQYLLYFVEQGVLGGIFYLLYIFFGVKEIKKNSGSSLYLALPFVGYAVATVFVNLSNGRTVWLVFALMNYLYLSKFSRNENTSLRPIK